jgi:hypothetical protein
MQLSTTLRTARATDIETQIGTSPILRVFAVAAGSVPANCAAASAGTVLVEMTLPADWATQASGVFSLAGVWQDASANATGTGRYFRVFESTGTTCHLQGTVSITAGSGELKFNAPDAGGADAGLPAFVSGQAVTISSFTITEGNA